MTEQEAAAARRHRAIFESAVDFAIIATDTEGRVTDWNPGAVRIFGWTAEEMAGEATDRILTAEDRAQGRPAAEMRQALDNGRASDERWHLRRDGSRFWADGEMMPLRDGGGAHLGFLKVLRDRAEQRQAEEAREASAAFLQSVLASSGDCIKVLNLDGNLTFMSEGGQRVMEVSDFNAIRGCPWPDFWQGQGNVEARAALDAAKAGGTGRFQGMAETMAGTPRHWDVQVTPIPGADGRPDRLLSVSRDITATRQAEAALREAQGLNVPLLNSSRDCIVVLDLDGRTQFVSPGGIESMEVADVDAILGLSWLRVWKGADHEAARAAVAEARAGGTGRFQGFCTTHKGTPKWWDVVISPLPGPDGKPERLVSVGRDVTEAAHAQERLNLSEARLRLAIDAAEVGTWDLDLQSDTLTWSDRTKAMFGISPDMPCSMTDFYAGLHPEDRDVTGEAFASALDPVRRSTYDVEYRTIGKEDGVVRWVAAKGRGLFDDQGSCMRAIGTAIDVSARRAVDERLRESEAELRALNATLEARVEERTRERDRAWKNSRDLQAVLGTSGVFQAANEAWTAILGWSPDEVAGRSYLDLIHPDDHTSSEQALATASGADLPVYENRYRHKDGTYRWISWVAAPEDGLIYASGRHVTAEKEAAAAFEAMQEQLRQSQKMEAVGQLTGGLAHDFNNLLAGISGSLELMQARMAQGRIGDLERYLAAAQGAAKRAAALTHRLLAFSRRQTLDPKPTDVNRLVSGMEELVRRTVGPAVTVEVVAAGGLWATLVDPNQLENALLNLCINARDAMPDGGRLTIETGNRWLDQRAARERDLPPGQYVSVCVSDTGTGMAPEVSARAFDPFYTTKPIGMGTGLGLSMVYGFVRQSGGQARIYSEPGQGTMLCLYLPRRHGEAENADGPGELAEAPRAGQGETVLVVDDEPTVRMLVTEVLGDLGYTAIEAADGPAGLRVLQSNARVDLLVTDVGLPGGMNGRQVADAARERRPGLKVLFITGYAENAVFNHGHLDPGMHVMTKPFAMEALASRIKELIAGP